MRIVAALALSLFSLISIAQDLDRLIPVDTPPAPDVSSLGKYGDIPVSPYTGVPNISVPIYQIQVRDISLPISLNYHASGIQVKEEASWIGLGWNLSAGGSVTRNIRGLDDFREPNGFLLHRNNMPQEPPKSPHESPFQMMYYAANADGNTPTVNLPNPNGGISNYYADLIDRTMDWASDIYYFNCGGLSGKFVIGRDGQMKPLDHQDIKIETTNRQNGTFAGWKITSADGTQYFFGNTDSSHGIYDPYCQYSTTESTEINVEGFGVANNKLRSVNDPENVISSWFVKEIVSPLGERITFTYEKFFDEQDVIAPIPDYAHYFIEDNIYCLESTGYSPTQGRISLNYTLHQPHYLKQIDFKNGYLKFNRDPTKRQDLSGAERLTDIQIFQKSSTTGQEKLIRTFELKNNDYFTSTNAGNNYNSYLPGSGNALGFFIQDFEASNSKRLKLTEVVESNGNLSRSHQFHYNVTNLPLKTSYSIDHWGYFNGKTNAHLVPGIYWNTHSIYINAPNDPNYTEVIVNGTEYPGANRDADVDFSTAALLKQIIYPTGGSTEFTYQSNQYTEDNILKNGGGVRIAKIEDHDPVVNKSIVKVYKYQNGILATPVRNFMIKYCYYTRLSVSGCDGLLMCNGPNGGWYSYNSPSLYRYASAIYPMSNSAGGSLVGYDKVELWYGENAENGKTIYEFHNQPDKTFPVDVQGFTYWPGIPPLFDLQNGNLLKQIDYANDPAGPSGFRKVKSIKNNYVDLTVSWPNKTKYHWYMFVDSHILPNFSGTAAAWTYPVPTVWNHLVSTEEIFFDPNEIELRSDIKYNFHDAPPAQTKHHQLLSKSVTSSDGRIRNSLYSYPADYATSAMNGDIATLISDYKMNRVIEERTVDNETNGKSINGIVTEYNSSGQPIQIFSAENVAPIAGVATNPADIIPDNTLFKKRAVVSYDPDKNVSAQKKIDNVVTSYLWGYGKTLPIAEVKNAEPNLTTEILTEEFERSTTTTGEIADYEQMGGYFDVDQEQTIFFDRTTEIISGSSPSANIEIKINDEGGGNGIYSTTSSYFSISLPPGRYTLSHKSSISWAGGPGSGDLHIVVNFSVDRTVKRQNIFHTSFEDDAQNIYSEFKTGNRSHIGPYTIIRPSSNGKYVLTYWSKPSSPGGDWSYHSSVLDITQNSENITIGNGSTLIDEIRFYPKDAKMTTYTYDPLIGMTSTTDINNLTTYYEYDDLGRLLFIKNEKREIEKQFTYHYKE